MKLDSPYLVCHHRWVVVPLFYFGLGFALFRFVAPGFSPAPAYLKVGATDHRSVVDQPLIDRKQGSRIQNRKSKIRMMEAYTALPLSFEANAGQADARVKFLSRGSGYTLFLTGAKAVLSLKKPGVSPVPTGSRESQERGNNLSRSRLSPVVLSPLAKTRGQGQRTANHELRAKNSVLAMQLVGANPNAPARGLDQLPGRSNYFIGSDPNKWHIDVPSYGKVKFDNVYPGVDLVYYGKQRQLEYDFVVAPGADPGSITLDLQAAGSGLEARNSKLAGAQSKSQNLKSRIDRDGDLVVEIAGNEVRFHKPIVYQPVGGSGLQVPAFAVPNPKSKIQD